MLPRQMQSWKVGEGAIGFVPGTEKPVLKSYLCPRRGLGDLFVLCVLRKRGGRGREGEGRVGEEQTSVSCSLNSWYR